MRYIAHRGLFDGPNPDTENSPDQIRLAVENGFDVEFDLWLIDDKFFLGHDKPVYQVDRSFLRNYDFWIHCKNPEALFELSLSKDLSSLNYFWHEDDDFTMTSQGHIWAFPRMALNEHVIWNQPEWDIDWRGKIYGVECLGICSKHIAEIKEMKSFE